MANALGQSTYVIDQGGKSSGMSLTLPKAVGNAPKAIVAGAPGAIPGIVLNYEAADSTGGGPMVLVGSIGKEGGATIEQVVTGADTAIRAFSPGAQITAADGPIPGSKRITSVGQQAFSIGGANQNQDGRTDVLIVPTPTHTAIVIYRSTNAAAQPKQFQESVELSIRTIKVDAAAAPAAPAAS